MSLELHVEVFSVPHAVLALACHERAGVHFGTELGRSAWAARDLCLLSLGVKTTGYFDRTFPGPGKS